MGIHVDRSNGTAIPNYPSNPIVLLKKQVSYRDKMKSSNSNIYEYKCYLSFYEIVAGQMQS